MKFKFLAKLPKFECGEFYVGENDHEPYAPPYIPEYSGSQAPTPHLMKDRIRCYFSARDVFKKSHCFYYDLDRNNPAKVLYKHEESVIPLGAIGEADEDGVMCSQIIQDQILYTGWDSLNRSNVRYRTSCMSYDKGVEFKDILCERAFYAPCGTSMPFLDERRDLLYFMGFTKWENSEPQYSIFADYYLDFGIGYQKTVCEEEGYSFARPVLLSLNNRDLVFYSKRGNMDYRKDPAKMYKMYVKREDREEKLIKIEGDDSVMMCYGYPLKVGKKVYLFYNSGSFTSEIKIAELV